jgi:hypothetical protein
MKTYHAKSFMPISRRGLLLQSLVFGGALAMPKWAGRAFAANDGVCAPGSTTTSTGSTRRSTRTPTMSTSWG